MNNVTDFNKFKKESDMQQTKYDELKGMITQLQQKVTGQARLVQSLLMLSKNYEARLSALKELSVGAGVFTDDSFEEKADSYLGLRRKTNEEDVTVGDICWCAYKATAEGMEPFNEEGLPVRVGSNTVIFEAALIGKKAGMKGIEHKATMKGENGQPEKEVTFTIDILKAKTKIVEHTVEVNDGTKSESEPCPEAGGLGHEELGPSEHPVV